MTDAPQVHPEGEPDPAPPRGSFGDEAAENMATWIEEGAQRPSRNRETEVEADISGVAEMIEEGAPLEPGDLPDARDDDACVDDVAMALAERTADLQRLQAEYLNYKHRVERDRELVRENATYQALAPIIDVLDNIDRAREHGPLDEGFRGVAEQLERVVAQQGLIRFGAPGDAFDPTVHEALSHIGEDADVEVTTCKVIAKAGYRIGQRVVRAAQVLVVDPADSSDPEHDTWP